ncbi:DUF5085 family protein [Bacillus timonensis]|uniref:DUF5085 family protein n=1 Tax=Bacillus timonensis TaxID=1033734 RepID=A0A4S3PRU2_9BACI|nr:DUF5085 family protein [Bacillus timonensis]THE12417.1 DUF5085 family protein [Bacillus timonensis]
MKVKRSPVTFQNVISTKARTKINEWHQTAKEFRNAILRNDLYSIGPIIYRVSNFSKETQEADYTFFIPVNAPVKMADNDRFEFTSVLEFEDGLSFRHADLDEDIEIAYDLLREAAHANELELEEPFYNIYLDVYGSGIIDVYAPIVKVAEHD